MALTVFCRKVTCDLRYDFAQEELEFCFNDSSPRGVLHVCLFEMYEDDYIKS